MIRGRVCGCCLGHCQFIPRSWYGDIDAVTSGNLVADVMGKFLRKVLSSLNWCWPILGLLQLMIFSRVSCLLQLLGVNRPPIVLETVLFLSDWWVVREQCFWRDWYFPCCSIFSCWKTWLLYFVWYFERESKLYVGSSLTYGSIGSMHLFWSLFSL